MTSATPLAAGQAALLRAAWSDAPVMEAVSGAGRLGLPDCPP